ASGLRQAPSVPPRERFGLGESADQLVVVDLPARMLRAVHQHHRQAVPVLHGELSVGGLVHVDHLQARARPPAQRDELAVDPLAAPAARARQQSHRVRHASIVPDRPAGRPRSGCQPLAGGLPSGATPTPTPHPPAASALIPVTRTPPLPLQSTRTRTPAPPCSACGSPVAPT